MPEENKIKVVMVKPREKAFITEIDNSLEAMQEAVRGPIESIMPFEDEVAIVMNEEGKLRGLTPNRLIRSKNGRNIDVICGTFFICYAPFESENVESLPDELAKKCLEFF